MRIESAEINGKLYDAGSLNILVGKNNSGKSTLLKELCASSRSTFKSASGTKWVNYVVVETGGIKRLMDSIFTNNERLREVDELSARDAIRLLRPRAAGIANQDDLSAFHGSRLSSIGSSSLYDNNGSIKVKLSPNADIEPFSSDPRYIVKYCIDLAASICVKSEFCDTRLSESFETIIEDVNDLEQSPVDQTAKLFCDQESLCSLNAILEKVFGFRVGFNNIRQAKVYLRIIPQDIECDSFNNEVEKSHWWEVHSPKIKEQGDGIKAFLKLLMSLRDDSASVIFIDEPETFLHPPQRRAIGEAIASAANCGKQIFVATHDADVVRGMLTGEVSPNVLYLNGINGGHTVEIISLTSLVDCGMSSKSAAKHGVQMMNEKVINSLFFDKTILVESENDRLIYELFCQQRLYTEYQGKCFLGLNGSDTVLNLFDLMAASGMTVCCITDIDFLLSRDLSSREINASDQFLRERHVAFANKMHSLNDYQKLKKRMKAEGISVLEGELLDSARQLIESYGRHGVHIVPVGELESWFSIPGKNGIASMVSQVQDDERDFAELTSFMKRVLE